MKPITLLLLLKYFLKIMLLSNSDRTKYSLLCPFLFFRHGDTVYLVPNIASTTNSTKESPVTSNSNESPQKNSSSNIDTAPDVLSTLKEDEVDIILTKESGCIQRERNPNL